LPRDDSETRRSAERENESADILWLNNHNVEQKPRVPGPKNPDYRIDNEIFDNYAPKTGNVRNIWRYVVDKVEMGQAPNIIIDLADSTARMSDISKQFNDYPITGLGRLWVIDQGGKLIYLLGEW
jgi:filamentous hemagglutinin